MGRSLGVLEAVCSMLQTSSVLAKESPSEMQAPTHPPRAGTSHGCGGPVAAQKDAHNAHGWLPIGGP